MQPVYEHGTFFPIPNAMHDSDVQYAICCISILMQVMSLLVLYAQVVTNGYSDLKQLGSYSRVCVCVCR